MADTEISLLVHVEALIHQTWWIKPVGKPTVKIPVYDCKVKFLSGGSALLTAKTSVLSKHGLMRNSIRAVED